MHSFYSSTLIYSRFDTFYSSQFANLFGVAIRWHGDKPERSSEIKQLSVSVNAKQSNRLDVCEKSRVVTSDLQCFEYVGQS